jgi:hypothetical protein
MTCIDYTGLGDYPDDVEVVFSFLTLPIILNCPLLPELLQCVITFLGCKYLIYFYGLLLYDLVAHHMAWPRMA